MLIFSSVPIRPAAAASGQLFSFTLLAPTSNPTRRQYAAIIQNSYEQAGLGVNLVYVSFTVLDTHLFPSSCPCGQLYSAGGFDAAFIGWGGGAPIPDWRAVTHYHTEASPPTGNYVYYHNTTVDSLIDQYQTSTSLTQRTQLGQQIVSLVAQERPYAVIYYPADIFAFKNYLTTWGQGTSGAKYTETDPGDYEHWSLASGSGSTINIGVTGTLNDFNPLPSSTSNTIYNLYVYGAINIALQEFDPRSTTYDNALATSITSSSDLLNWTVSFHPTNFIDSAPVTADDFIFYYQSSLRNEGISVNEGSYQSSVGLYSQFTYLNGTSHYDLNGTYYETVPTSIPKSLPTTPTSTFKAVSPTSFTFHVPTAYVFTNPILTGVAPLPIHILGGIPESSWDTNNLVTGQMNTPQTVTWNKSLYGGNGSFAYAYGFIGAGPYVYKGYNPVSQVATLVANPNYYNATGLQAMGLFNAKTVHIDSVVTKSGALAAFANNAINFMDTNFQFTTSDLATVASSGGYYTKVVSASAGMQELGFNMNDPVFGTGTATPNGQKDPTNAARYARYVRNALSDLIPRQYIIDSLLQGAAVAGVTEMPVVYTTLYPPSVTADPYSPADAATLLAMAGYGSYTAPPPVLPAPPPVSPITAGNITVSVPSFLLGNSITFQGTFSYPPILGVNSNGFAVVLQQSTDNKTWTNLFFTSTTVGGNYLFTYTPTQAGTFSYRVLFTGIPMNVVNRDAINNPDTLLLFVTPGTGQQNVTDTQTSATASYKIGTLSSVINQLASGISTQLQNLGTGTTNGLNSVQTSLNSKIDAVSGEVGTLTTSVNTANNNINSLTSQINTLNSQVSTLTTIAYAAIAIAIVLGLVAIFMARRKPAG